MSLLKRRIYLTASLLLASLALAMGQGCSKDSSTAQELPLTTEGNGDYYSGKIEQIAESVSSYTRGMHDDSETLEPKDPPSIPDPNDCPDVNGAMCTNGERQALYTGCKPAGSKSVLYGFSHLKYSSLTCDMNTVGDTIHSRYGLLFITPLNHKLAIGSAQHTDYRGITMGGGDALGIINSGVILNSFGKRVVLKGPADNTLFDHSGRSLVPTVVIFDRVAKTKTIAQGSTEFMDNLGKWTAKYTVEQLTFQRGCCHPISGSVTAEFSDAITGKGRVEFLSCGKALLNIDGRNYPMNLRSCD